MEKILVLALGSLAGGFARYWLAGWGYRVFGTNFPVGTLLVNLVGCFLVGIFSVLAEKKFLLGPEARLLLMTGFCGAFTTFSTLILETGHLVADHDFWKATLNVALSVGLGFLVFKLGAFLAELG